MKFNDLEFQPIILGADITAYSLARSFHEQYGIKSITLSMTQTGYVNSSDIIENRYYPNMEKDEVAVERLIEVGKEFQGKKKLIVFGCGDWYVRIIIENKEKLKPYYIIPYIDEDLLNRIVLKDKFYEIFEELGLDYPKTYVYEFGKENDLKFDFDYPVIAKPANSALYHYAKFEGKKKVFRFENEEELRTMMDRVEKVFNIVWEIPQNRTRGKSYLVDMGITLLIPFIIVIFFLGSVVYTNVFDWIFPKIPGVTEKIQSLLGWLIFAVITIFTLSSMYKFIPNTHVHYKYALQAALISGIAFTLLQYLYLETQLMVTRLNAVYGTIAAIPLFLLWLRFGWLIIIFGVQFTYSFQTIGEQDQLPAEGSEQS